MALLLIALLLVLGGAFAVTAAEHGADSRDMYADSYHLPHSTGLS